MSWDPTEQPAWGGGKRARRRRDRYSLAADLRELERTDPDVAAAADEYTKVAARILATAPTTETD